METFLSIKKIEAALITTMMILLIIGGSQTNLADIGSDGIESVYVSLTNVDYIIDGEEYEFDEDPFKPGSTMDICFTFVNKFYSNATFWVNLNIYNENDEIVNRCIEDIEIEGFGYQHDYIKTITFEDIQWVNNCKEYQIYMEHCNYCDNAIPMWWNNYTKASEGELELVGLKADPNPAMRNNQFSIGVRIKNTANFDMDKNYALTCYDHMGFIDRDNITCRPLDADEEVCYNYYIFIWPDRGGAIEFNAVVDCYNVIDEWNEYDNDIGPVKIYSENRAPTIATFEKSVSSSDGHEIRFICHAYDPEGDCIEYIRYDFGDNSVAESLYTDDCYSDCWYNTTHRYSKYLYGEKTVTCTVEDEYGAKNTKTLPIELSESNPIQAFLSNCVPSQGQTITVDEGETVQFSAHAYEGSGEYKFIFNVGDATVNRFDYDDDGYEDYTHTYLQEGTYTTSISLKDLDTGEITDVQTTAQILVSSQNGQGNPI
jgi:hypothetical protein